MSPSRMAVRIRDIQQAKEYVTKRRMKQSEKGRRGDVQPLNAFPFVFFVPLVYVESLTCSRLRFALAPVAWRSWRWVVLGG